MVQTIQFQDSPEVLGLNIDIISMRTSKDSTRQETSIQTDKISFAEISVQSLDKVMKATQTIQEELSTKFEEPKDLNSFQEFLNRAEKEMSLELLQNIKSVAMDEFEQFLVKREGLKEIKNGAECLELIFKLSSENIQQPVTSISWSCTGTTIAISYGNSNHSGWYYKCPHHGVLVSLAIWNLALRKRVDESHPNHTLETESCLTSIMHHPKNPNIIAGGTYNGEVIVWDIDKLEEHIDPIQATSRFAKESNRIQNLRHLHYDAIIKLLWIPNRLGDYQLVSFGSLGKILFWEMDPSQRSLYPTKGIQLNHTDVSEKTTSKAFAIGITSATYLLTRLSTVELLIGTEVGHVARISVDNFPSLAGMVGDLKGPMMKPFIYHNSNVSNDSYHDSSVQSLSGCPYLPDVLISSSSDGRILLSSTNLIRQSKTVLEPIEISTPLSSVLFVPFVPGFIVSAGFQTLRVYNLLLGERDFLCPVYSINLPDKDTVVIKGTERLAGLGTLEDEEIVKSKKGQNIGSKTLKKLINSTTMQFAVGNRLLAVGDDSGRVTIWEMDQLFSEDYASRVRDMSFLVQ